VSNLVNGGRTGTGKGKAEVEIEGWGFVLLSLLYVSEILGSSTA
jgi:hypothetical protein